MSLPVFTSLFYWSAFWHPLRGGSRRREDVFPNRSTRHLSPRLFFHRRNSNLGTNLCGVVAKIDELLDWESARLHSRGNNKSLGLPSRRAPWRVACSRRSSPLPSSAPPELKSLSPSLRLSFFPPPIPFSPVTAVTGKVVLGTGGHAPFVCASLCVGAYMCAMREKDSHCLLWWHIYNLYTALTYAATSPELVSHESWIQ